MSRLPDREAIWTYQNEGFRDPAEIVVCWPDMNGTDQRLLEFEAHGRWWETLDELAITLLVSREYEHLLLSMTIDRRTGPLVRMMRMPHPSGLAVDRTRGVVHVACTRNPNQVFDLMPSHGLIPRSDVEELSLEEKPLVPIRTRFLPGCLYIHDLAMVADELHANSVGQNAIVKLSRSGDHKRVWWPKCIESEDGPIFGQNHLQLNSIAAGETLEASYFSASTDEITQERPGDPSFPVDRRGVIFSGGSRDVIARGLTRPHSARLQGNRIWVDNSGYGEVGFIEGEKFRVVSRLPGWTRGLCFIGDVMFVGTSRILPRFRQYAPGLDIDEGRCGIHALDVKSGELLGSIIWPYGSQVFAVEWVPADFTSGLPFRPDGGLTKDYEKLLFYSFRVPQED
jgi:uncharacterized protein (TIGR03032 family)